MKYLLKTVFTYRVGTIDEVEALHNDLLENPTFDLTAFSYKTKQIKAKGEVIEEYQIVSATVIFTEEKNPERIIAVEFEEM